jgi:TPR repeat protein
MKKMEEYYPCCGKTICKGCVYSFSQSGNTSKCPFCNSDRADKTVEENIEDLMKRAEANDPILIYLLADSYYNGLNSLHQDQIKAMELYARASDLGCSKAHNFLGSIHYQGGDMKKAKFHYEAAAMAGHEVARYNIGVLEYNSGNTERAIKHLTIGASAGDHKAMHEMRVGFKKGYVSKESIDSTLVAYNNACAEMRSKARDAAIRIEMNILQTMNNT